MRRLVPALAVLTLLAPAAAQAGSVQVSPTTVDLSAARRAATVTVRNGDTEPVKVQVRVFRWTRVDGEETLTPTTDVVASPPAAELKPGAAQLIRIVRVTDKPAAQEEGYRVLIDELPDPERRKAGQIALVLRQSVPIFFTSTPGGAPQVSWRLVPGAAGHELVARNTGARRLRVADLQLKSAAGDIVHRQNGLAGYVLAGQEMRWAVTLNTEHTSRRMTVSAVSDIGAVNVDLGPPS